MTQHPRRRDVIEGSIGLGLCVGLAGCGALSGSSGTTIEYGDSVDGEITESSPRDPKYNGLGEKYTFEASSGDAIRATMSSSTVDSYLMLADGNGTVLAEADDESLDSLDSLLVDGFEDGGTYVLWATSLDGSVTGSFELELSVLDTADDAPDPRSISVGQTVEGAIDPFDGHDPEYLDLAEPLSLSLDARQRVRMTLRSDDFDPYLVMTDGDGSLVAERDDGSEGTDAVLSVTLDEGTYTLWAGSFLGHETGSYTLAVSAA